MCFEPESRALASWGAFHFILTTCQELCEELSHQRVSDILVEEEINVFDYELEKLIFHIKRQMLEVLLPFISFIHGFKKKKL